MSKNEGITSSMIDKLDALNISLNQSNDNHVDHKTNTKSQINHQYQKDNNQHMKSLSKNNNLKTNMLISPRNNPISHKNSINNLYSPRDLISPRHVINNTDNLVSNDKSNNLVNNNKNKNKLRGIFNEKDKLSNNNNYATDKKKNLNNPESNLIKTDKFNNLNKRTD